MIKPALAPYTRFPRRYSRAWMKLGIRRRFQRSEWETISGFFLHPEHE
jgi:hypothetical protein